MGGDWGWRVDAKLQFREQVRFPNSALARSSLGTSGATSPPAYNCFPTACYSTSCISGHCEWDPSPLSFCGTRIVPGERCRTFVHQYTEQSAISCPSTSQQQILYLDWSASNQCSGTCYYPFTSAVACLRSGCPSGWFSRYEDTLNDDNAVYQTC